MSAFRVALKLVKKSAIKRGLFRTMVFLVGEYWADLKFGINTHPTLIKSQPSSTKKRMQLESFHFGTNWFILREIFVKIIPKLKINFSSAHMIDYGSGAGRALVAASYLGISKVTGVEQDKTLCTLARKNIHKYIRKNTKKQKIRVVNKKASSYAIPQSANLFYLYNPFGRAVLRIVIKKILSHIKRAKKKALIIYVNPLYGNEFENAGFKKSNYSNQEVAIYEKS